jgi:hypothetical protein
MKKAFWRLLAAMPALLFAACSAVAPLSSGGSGTETTTGISGSVLYPSGKPASHARVIIRPSDYVSSANTPRATISYHDTVTDSDGTFHIPGMDTGSFSIEINDNATSNILVQHSVHVNEGIQNLGSLIIRPYAKLGGSVDTAGRSQGNLYIQVEGLERLQPVGADGSFEISNLPEGSFTIRCITAGAPEAASEVSNVKELPGAVSTVSVQAGWRYSRVLYLNTTSEGADVTEDETGFPVLIRLNQSNFDFSQARDSGQDLRFAKADGTPLSYEIESYDLQGLSAVIWVRMDTVAGNTANQSLVMSWGNSNATSLSDSRAVFDTAAGFEAVWHLNNNCSDATGNSHDGTNYGPVDAAGMIGNCKNFSGSDSIKINGLLGSRQVLTMSAWVKSSAVDTTGYEILSIGRDVLIRLDVKKSLFATGMFHIYDQDSNKVAWVMMQVLGSQQNAWHFVSYSVDAVNHVQLLYMDNDLAAFSNDTEAVDYSGLGSNTYIGSFAKGSDNSNFIGLIDEVRVSKVFRSQGWSRLCFMNQKPSEALVEY